MDWTGPKLKLRTARESVGWMNSVGPLPYSPVFKCDNLDCGCQKPTEEFIKQRVHLFSRADD